MPVYYLALIESFKSRFFGGFYSLCIFFVRDSPVQGRMLLRLVAGIVLGHYVRISIRRDIFGEEPYDLLCSGLPFGKHQVSYKQAPLCYPVLVNKQIPDLTVHLFYSCFCDRGVIFCL